MFLSIGTWWYQRDVAESVPDSIIHDSENTNSIAVLPFVNMSDEPGNEYFVDGLTEELQILLAIDPDYARAWVGLSWAYEYQRSSRGTSHCTGT